MAKMQLTLANLPELDLGKVDAAFTRHLARAVADCTDRPGDPTARKVVIEFQLKPARDQTGDCSTISLEAQIHSKVPAHRSRTFECTPQGTFLAFNAESPDDVEQRTFTDLKEEQENAD